MLLKQFIYSMLPLALYMLIGLLVLTVYPNGGLVANIIEKLFCAVIMGYLYWNDSKFIKQRHESLKLSDWICLILAGAAGCIGVNLLLSETGITDILQKDVQSVSNALYTDKLWLQILAIGIAAPIAEELLFRGIIYRRLRIGFNIFIAALISILIFGAMHGNLLQAIYAILLGMLLIWVYERFARIEASILVHMSANCMSLLIQQSKTVSGVINAMPVLWCLLCLLVVFVIIWYEETKGKSSCRWDKSCL